MANILVRNLNSDDVAWLEESIPPGMSRESYIRSIISEKRNAQGATSPARTANESPSDFRFIDLFAGIGGFYMGATKVGGECVFTSEWDKYAAATYRAWTGSSHVNQEDIRSLDYAEAIPEHELLLAGFPCQPFSIAGVSKKNSLGRVHGFDDEKQGNLFFAICAIAEAKRPPIMLLENVKNLKSHDKGNTWKVIQETLDQLGYEVRSQIIDAKGWVPQHRERIFIVCFDRSRFTNDEIEQFKFPSPAKEGPKLASILSQEPPPEKYMLTDNLWRYLQAYAAKHRAKGNGFGYQLVGPADISRTMSARYHKDGSEILIDQPEWRNPRRLTPSEAALLMGFNSSFSSMTGHGSSFPQVVSDTQAYKQFGNSVCPLVVEAIVGSLKPLLLKVAR